ncbi:hypothetical protein [Streptomyces sp. KLOTTS4A1]|uniref:hypothetical protein n=1 Tax=Streptomyces sp. KLOTTS4A1 TaxID=3390996 RepID=UPI0039F49E2A
MRTRTTKTIGILATLALAVVGCGSEDSGDQAKQKPPNASSKPTEQQEDNTAAQGRLPDEPTGAERDAVLAAIRDVLPELVQDEDKAIDAARRQCQNLDNPNSAGMEDTLAAMLFMYSGAAITEEHGKHLNAGLRKTLCPDS